MTGPYLFHARTGQTYVAIVFYNGWTEMVRFITLGGLDPFVVKWPNWIWLPKISFAGALRYGRFDRLEPHINGNACVESFTRQRRDWLSTVPQPRKRTVRAREASDWTFYTSDGERYELNKILRQGIERDCRGGAKQHRDNQPANRSKRTGNNLSPTNINHARGLRLDNARARNKPGLARNGRRRVAVNGHAHAGQLALERH